MSAGAPAARNAVAIIPARLGSTRLPGKVLLSDTGKPLIQHVWESARAARCLARVAIATDDARVFDAVQRFGGECVMTSPDHPNGTSRLSEAARMLGLHDDQIIVNVQGDEPEVEADAIDDSVEALIRGEAQAGGASMSTIAVPFQAGEDPGDPNCVKVVLDHQNSAMYFSRSLIPMDRDRRGGADAAPLRHVGLYVYRRRFLDEYVAMPPAPPERAEQLEQLRARYYGKRIMVAVRAHARIGIDTPEQYAAFVRRARGV